MLENEEDLLEKLEEYKTKYLLLAADKQKAEAKLMDAIAEVKVSLFFLYIQILYYLSFHSMFFQFAKEQAIAGEKGRAELENVNKQLVLIGELQLKYRERLEELSSLRRSDQELVLLTESYNADVKSNYYFFYNVIDISYISLFISLFRWFSEPLSGVVTSQIS